MDSVDNSQTTASSPHCPQPYDGGFLQPEDQVRRITVNTGQHGTTFGVNPSHSSNSMAVNRCEKIGGSWQSMGVHFFRLHMHKRRKLGV